MVAAVTVETGSLFQSLYLSFPPPVCLSPSLEDQTKSVSARVILLAALPCSDRTAAGSSEATSRFCPPPSVFHSFAKH